MTFTEEVKGELIRVVDADSCCRRATLSAIIRCSGNLQLSRSGGLGLNLPTQSPGVARAILRLIKEHQPDSRVFIRKRSSFRKNNMYLIFSPDAGRVLQAVGLWDEERNSVEFKNEILRSQCCLRSYLRGAFLMAGTINNPKGSSYHLEIVSEYESQAAHISGAMQTLGLKPKVVRRKELHVVYIKDFEQMTDFLNFLGAHTALLRMEEARVMKDMRNKVNRLVNAETANLNKTIDASWRQLEAIRYIDQRIGILALPKHMQDLAEARSQNPDASLQELGQYLSPPLSKSAVNHRLRKLMSIAKDMGYKE